MIQQTIYIEGEKLQGDRKVRDVRRKRQGIDDFYYVRRGVQFIFLITCLFIGYRFMLFAGELGSGLVPLTERPPGVEAFLPISALISLKYMLLTGEINQIHPSGLLIFLFIIASAILFKKSFCSWICPVGFLSEVTGGLRDKLLGRKFRIHRYLDYILRLIKYFLLGFFLWTVFLKMGLFVLRQFLFSSYNIIADIKMLQFFTDISPLALGVISLLLFLTFVFQNFWCRYLCPYGALLGITSFASPFKIRRHDSGCTSCGRCDSVCPSGISVSSSFNVTSDECFACGKCVDACPEKGVLSLSLPGKAAGVRPVVVGACLILLFAGGSLVARSSGVWQNKVSGQAYLTHMLENDLLDLSKIEDMKSFAGRLDSRGKRLFMMHMMKGGGGPGMDRNKMKALKK